MTNSITMAEISAFLSAIILMSGAIMAFRSNKTSFLINSTVVAFLINFLVKFLIPDANKTPIADIFKKSKATSFLSMKSIDDIIPSLILLSIILIFVGFIIIFVLSLLSENRNNSNSISTDRHYENSNDNQQIQETESIQETLTTIESHLRKTSDLENSKEIEENNKKEKNITNQDHLSNTESNNEEKNVFKNEKHIRKISI